VPVYLQGESCSSVNYVGDADKYISNPENCHICKEFIAAVLGNIEQFEIFFRSVCRKRGGM